MSSKWRAPRREIIGGRSPTRDSSGGVQGLGQCDSFIVGERCRAKLRDLCGCARTALQCLRFVQNAAEVRGTPFVGLAISLHQLLTFGDLEREFIAALRGVGDEGQPFDYSGLFLGIAQSLAAPSPQSGEP